MAIYNFLRWEVNGVAAGTSTTLNLTVTGDVTVTAVYTKDQHVITFKTTPISVAGTVNGQTINNNEQVLIDHGAAVTFVVPATVNA